MKLEIVHIVVLFVLHTCFFYEVSAQEMHDGKVSPAYEGQTCFAEKRDKITNDYIGFYQKYISRIRGTECPMYPSCSNYGLKVFRDKSFCEGMLYTADRMLRCGHDKSFYNVTLQYGEKSLLDWPSYQRTPKDLVYKGSVILRTNRKSKQKDAYSFIQYLINQKQYEMALLEISRNTYFHTFENEQIYQDKLLCYEALEREEDGIFDYETNFPDSIQSFLPVAIKVAKLYYKLDNYDRALAVLNTAESMNPDDVYRKMIFQSILQVRKSDYDSAISILNQAQMQFPENSLVLTQNLQLVDAIKSTPLKSPVLARILSIIPGGGYAYSKQYQTAITSFLINAVLGYATYSCIKRENYGMACLTGVFSLTFYFGNIMGGGKSAHRYNRTMLNNQINKLVEINGLSYY